MAHKNKGQTILSRFWMSTANPSHGFEERRADARPAAVTHDNVRAQFARIGQSGLKMLDFQSQRP
jgi:hypothetical protein